MFSIPTSLSKFVFANRPKLLTKSEARSKFEWINSLFPNCLKKLSKYIINNYQYFKFVTNEVGILLFFTISNLDSSSIFVLSMIRQRTLRPHCKVSFLSLFFITSKIGFCKRCKSLSRKFVSVLKN